MPAPLAYLLTWTCYGTWLHGDERGSVDDEHHVFGDQYAPTDPARTTRSSGRLRQKQVNLDESARAIVGTTIEQHCRIKGWELLALNVRTNHVHVVVAVGDVSPRVALSQFKAWTTRRLREAGHVGADAAVWTRRGSSRYLWDLENVAKAVAYVTDYQGDDLER
ncbi:MAG: transposase [Planctomycetes bacterium]|nr:transposase [Planctomycetota bacterium]